MARISRDGAHSEMTADPKRRKKQSAGPTAAELNQAQQEFSEKQEKVQRTEKNATYTGKYLDAKMDLTSGAKQSYLDYQVGIAADEKTLAQLDQDYAINPTPELQQRRDALNASIERQKDALTVYEKSWRDSESSQETLQQQYGYDYQNYQTAFDEGTSSRNNYIELLSGYEGDDLENLSEDARADVRGVHKLVLCKVKSNLNDQLTEVNQEIKEIKEQISGVFSADPEFSNEANDLYFQNMEKLEVLEGQQKYLKTELYLLEGEMNRNDQKYEALKDPDFLKYVEKGYASMREIENFSRRMQLSGAGQPDNRGAAYSDAAVHGYEDIRFMSPMDQKIYAYYYAKDPSGQKAKAYKDSLQRQINESRNRPYLEWVLQNAEADPLGAGIASIPGKALGGAMAFAEGLTDFMLPEEQKGLLADPYTPGNTMLAGSQLSRQVGLDQIDNPMLKKGAEYFYSTADTLPARAFDYIGLPIASAAYMGLMRATDGYTTAALQGATVEEALRQGKVDGALGAYLRIKAYQDTKNVQGGAAGQSGGAGRQSASSDPPNPALPETAAAPELNDGPKGNLLQKDGKETGLLPNLLGDDTGDPLQREEIIQESESLETMDNTTKKEASFREPSQANKPFNMPLTEEEKQRIIQDRIENGKYSLQQSHQQYLKHVEGTPQYRNYLKTQLESGAPPQSRLTITEAESQAIIKKFHGTGTAKETRKGIGNIEYVTVDRIVGLYYEKGEWHETSRVAIHYGKNSSHIVPIKEDYNG